MAQATDMRSMGDIMSEAQKMRSLGIDKIGIKWVKKAHMYVKTIYSTRADGAKIQKQEWFVEKPLLT